MKWFALLLLFCSCEKSSGRRVRVQILNVPAVTTTLRAEVALEDRHQDYQWSGAALDAVVAGSTEFTVGIADSEKGPFEVRIEALAGGCRVAEKSESCLAVDAESCRNLKVTLPDPTSCPGNVDRDPDGGAAPSPQPDLGAGDLWDGRCPDGGVC